VKPPRGAPGALLLVLALAGCVSPPAVRRALDQTEQSLTVARGYYGSLCVPEVMAHAEAEAAFAQIELDQGSLRRGSEHAFAAFELSQEAAAAARPCGTRDTDADTIPDVVDDCPNEPEDMDGDRDEDGCRDLGAYDDDDGDSIRNIDDDCPYTPEDFDGDRDEDGCPETSSDGDGDGIVDSVDQCPEQAEDLDSYLDSDGCPDPDNDNDGLTDILDQCPKVAEDVDGWADDDGCPDPDNDLDGIPDMHDACPNEPGDRLQDGCPAEDADGDGVADFHDMCPDQPETRNDYLDEDGCPDTPPKRVSVTTTRVQVRETIQFQTGSATLLPASFEVLKDVQKVLVDAPNMRLRIEGHTDNEGTEDVNYRLSKERAESVKVFLASRGVDPARMEVVGYGETRPIDTNRTTSGRGRNRRVEFHIIE
jgi:OOP family OmpA-OmpF porin